MMTGLDFDLLHLKSDFNQFSSHLLNVLERVDLQWQKKIILEVGCGQGGHAPFLLNKKSLGVDISKVAIEKARIRYPTANFRVEDIVSMPVPEEKYDYILDSKLINCIDLKSLEQYLQFAQKSCGFLFAEVAYHKDLSENVVYESGRYIYSYEMILKIMQKYFSFIHIESVDHLNFTTPGMRQSYPICTVVLGDTKPVSFL